MIRSLALATALMLVLAGCGSKKPTATPTAETVLNPTATASGAPATSSTSQSPTPKATASQTQPPPTGPHIVFFRIKTKPSCPSTGGDPSVIFPGNPIELEWQAINVDNVTISIDGGLFGTYSPSFVHEFPFTCTGPSNSTQKHTYLLKTVGGGAVRQMTIVGEAHVS